MTFEILTGQTIQAIEGLSVGSERVTFRMSDGREFILYHSQSCCERVDVEDVCGDMGDLLGTPIVLADESESKENPSGVTREYQDSFTWTFYKLSTIKGSVTIRWYGESNGYYSEGVDFVEVTK